MKKPVIQLILIPLFSLLFVAQSFCQVQDDTTKILKNTIRINLTNPLIFGDKYNVIGYERVIGKHQSISANIGRFSLPKFTNIKTDLIEIQNEYSDKGFTFALDYRFYLRKENKYPAPKGVYIGPYYSFNLLQRSNTWQMDTDDFQGSVITDLNLNINLVGVQLGYQFIIKKRVALDLIVIGPGIWFYNARVDLSTSLEIKDEVLLLDKINEVLADKLPGHDLLLKPGDFKRNGSLKTSSPGLRYIFHLGFRF